MATKAQRQLASARRSRSNASRRRREQRSNIIRQASNGVVSGMVGAGSSVFEAIPEFFGAPRTAGMALVGGAISMFAKGAIADAGEGMLDSGIALTAYQYGQGRSGGGWVSGVPSLEEATSLEHALGAGVDGMPGEWFPEWETEMWGD